MTQARTIPKPSSAPASPQMGLAALRRQIALLEKLPQAGLGQEEGHVFAWGIGAIDRHLPGGGLALGALHEFAGAGPDLEEASLAAAAMARLIGRRHRHGRNEHDLNGSVLWVARQRDLYARALPQAGLDPDRLLHIGVRRNADALWALEEALRCRNLSAVVGEIASLDLTQSRRLQLAAEKSGVPAFLIRRGGRAGELRNLANQPSAALTRWRIGPAPSFGVAAPPHPVLPGPARWRLDLWRCRGGRPATWLIEEHEDGWREATFPQPVPAPLGDRLLASPERPADLRQRRTAG